MSSLQPSRVLAEFVAAQKTRFLEDVKAGKGNQWTVAMGNEAGDLDSLASAIGWAWYASTAAHPPTPTVPLLQTTRGDLPLRIENLHALALAGFSPAGEELLCINDVPTTSSKSPSASAFPATDFALVDHNRLLSRFSEHNSAARVVAIIDHHADEGAHADAEPRIVKVPTGSAASLVACLLMERCVNYNVNGESKDEAVEIPRELATLLLCAILVDTGGLKPGGKAEDADRTAAAFLLPRSLLHVSSPSQNFSFSATSTQKSLPRIDKLHEVESVQSLAQTLWDKKGDIAHLGTRDLLRRDYKEYNMTPAWDPSKPVTVGLATVPLGLKAWIAKDERFWAETEAYMRERGLGVLGILTTFRDVETGADEGGKHKDKHDKKHAEKEEKHTRGKHRREQLFVVRADAGEELAKRLFEGLKRNKELDLKKRSFVEDYGVKKGVGFSEGHEARVWKQGNVQATRKATAPAVKAIIEGA